MPDTALVLIARNEAPTIGRCLASVRPWVDRLLVLDTGSSDDTVRVALEAGARVEHFPWVDDFAAARKRALGLAGADWNLVLDADEWLTTGGPELAALRQLRPDFAGAIRIDSDYGAGTGAGRASSWITRLLPRGVRYAGRVHEQPVHALPVRRLHALKACGRHEQAVPLAESQLARWEGSPDYWFTLGDLLLDWGCEQPARAENLLPLIEAAWQRCLDLGERPDFEGAVHGRGSHLAAANLALLYEGIGRTDDARHCRALAAAALAQGSPSQ